MQQKTDQVIDILQRAVAEELEKKRRLGQYAIVNRDGKIIRLEGDDLIVKKS